MYYILSLAAVLAMGPRDPQLTTTVLPIMIEHMHASMMGNSHGAACFPADGDERSA